MNADRQMKAALKNIEAIAAKRPTGTAGWSYWMRQIFLIAEPLTEIRAKETESRRFSRLLDECVKSAIAGSAANWTPESVRKYEALKKRLLSSFERCRTKDNK